MALKAALTKHLRATDHFAALDRVTRRSGEWAGATFDVFNPSTGELLATLPDMGIEEAHAAIDAAARAQPLWAGMPAKERSAILRRWHDLIVEHADDLAAILTAEMGKPLGEAKGRFCMPHLTSSGMQRKQSASTVRPSRRRRTTAACW